MRPIVIKILFALSVLSLFFRNTNDSKAATGKARVSKVEKKAFPTEKITVD